MKIFQNLLLSLFIVLFFQTISHAQNSQSTDVLYRTLIASVENADFALMASAYHPDAVLVSPLKTTPIQLALIRWEKEGLAHKEKGGTATLNFRFAKRTINTVASFEVGVYRYSTIDKSGKETVYFAHFEDLHVKKDNKWLTIMENQTKKATIEEWNNLPNWH